MDKPGSSIGNLYKKLKQSSKVVQVAVVYIAACTTIITTAEPIARYLYLPSWIVTAIIFLIILFFPIALILAWASERTPSKKHTWLYILSIVIIAPIGFYVLLKIAQTDLNVPLSPTQSVDASKLKDDSTVTARLQKTEEQDTSISEHKEDTTITSSEDNKAISAKTIPAKQTKAKEVWHKILVQFDSLPPHVYSIMRGGSEEYNENGQVTWKIEKIVSSRPSISYNPTYSFGVPLNDGKRTFTASPGKENITCRMKLKVVRKGDAFYYRNKQLFLNDTIRFRSARYSEIGRITQFIQ